MRHRKQNAERLRRTIQHHLPEGTLVNYQALTSGIQSQTSGNSVISGFDTNSTSSTVLSAGRASQAPGPSDTALRDTIQEAASQLAQWRSSNQSQQELLAQNTAALQQNTSAQSNASKAGSLLRTASGVLGGGLGAIPLLSSIVSLFGGSSASKQTPLTYDITPPQIHFEQGIGSAGSSSPVYDQFGLPRVATRDSRETPGSQSITVNVHAMDSRSFMDHSFEIAQAVKGAMLNLHSINDVVNEL